MRRYAFLLALLLTIATMSVAANVANQQPSCQADTSRHKQIQQNK